MKTITINNKNGRFDDDEWRAKGLKAEVAYVVIQRNGAVQYAWSPDGIGCFWYEMMQDLVDQHG